MANEIDLKTKYKELYFGKKQSRYKEKVWSLFYRGKQILSNKTYADCKKEMYRHIRNNPLNYKQKLFQIKLITHEENQRVLRR